MKVHRPIQFHSILVGQKREHDGLTTNRPDYAGNYMGEFKNDKAFPPYMLPILHMQGHKKQYDIIICYCDTSNYISTNILLYVDF